MLSSTIKQTQSHTPRLDLESNNLACHGRTSKHQQRKGKGELVLALDPASEPDGVRMKGVIEEVGKGRQKQYGQGMTGS